jgi:hypothetical protein
MTIEFVITSVLIFCYMKSTPCVIDLPHHERDVYVEKERVKLGGMLRESLKLQSQQW